MALLPSLVFVAFSASFEAPVPALSPPAPPIALRSSPPSCSHAPVLLSFRWNFAVCHLVQDSGFCGARSFLFPMAAVLWFFAAAILASLRFRFVRRISHGVQCLWK